MLFLQLWMHVNQIHVNTGEHVQQVELITTARVRIDMKGTIAMKVGIVFLLLVKCFGFFHYTTSRNKFNFIY